MLPASYHVPAVLVLILGGTVAWFFGYRFFRIVLAIAGFIIGVLVAGRLFGTGESGLMLAVSMIGGLAGAGLMFAAYYVGVSLVGAGLGVVVGNLAFTAGQQDPQLLMVVLFAVVGSLAAMWLQRYFIVVGTSFGGAWMLLVGAMALFGVPEAVAAASSGQIWSIYPLDPAPGQRWLPLVWVILSLVGVVVQLGWTGTRRKR